MSRRIQEFQTIRSEGGLLPPDLLRRVIDPRSALAGTRPEDYGLPPGERLNEAITQSWGRLRRHWADFRAAAAQLPPGEAGTGLTNDRWNLPVLRELGFGLLPTSSGPEINGRTYAINRFFGAVPVHLVGCGLSLDRRAAGVRGAAAANPHGLVQEFLNRSTGHLWAMVSNGLRLRLLRDNQALSRQSFLEFDLEAMFGGEVYSDFVLLWLMVHASRFTAREGGRLESCWLEVWAKQADEQGTRALGELRGGVEKGLQILGEGLTSHPRNGALREALRSGTLPLVDFHGQLLRVIYRLIFLFVAEDRTLDGLPLLHPRDDTPAARTARERYAAHYSLARLRELAGTIKGSRHGDLWRQFQLVVRALAGEPDGATARTALALPALGSLLWSRDGTPALNDAELTNFDFLEVLRHLAFTRQGKVLRPVDYKNLGSEEFGGVYESLLGLTPQISSDGARFTFAEFAGNERKTSGSYYTPDCLVQCLLDSALDPVVEERIRGRSAAEAEQAILAMKVCDMAVGSGHFLVGAAHRLARHLARVRAIAGGESEPSPLLYQTALRDVIGHCLYGVDINPMAVELCKVTLWLEALEPGKPLSFLDHHIRCGNSLLGTTPELIAAGLPDAAFTAIEGDDKRVCTLLKRRNKDERDRGQRDMAHLMVAEAPAAYNSIAAQTRTLDSGPDATIEEIRAKAERFRRLQVSPEYRHAQRVADAWCAAFVWPKGSTPAVAEPLTTDAIRRLEADATSLSPAQLHQINRISSQYQFFHWHLAFPEVFGPRSLDGFDCILGNPPWERVKLQEKEWFAERSPDIASAPNAAARKRLIESLIASDPGLHQKFLDDCRKAEGESHLLRSSGLYPLCGRGDINLYTVFAEAMRSALNPSGRTGSVLPSGIATDDTTKLFFQDVIDRQALVSLFDFENRDGLFPGVHRSYKLCLFTAGRGERAVATAAEFVFFAHQVEDLHDPQRRFILSPEEIRLLNPNTRTCPIFRSRADAELTKAIYRRVPVLIREAQGDQPEQNPWGIKFGTMFHMANDSHLFRTREQLEQEGWTLHGNVFSRGDQEYLPLYEAKMIHHFDHRWATYDGLDSRDMTVAEKQNPNCVSFGRYWVSARDVETALSATGWNHNWLMGWRDICRSTDERTAIFSLMPLVAVGHTAPIILTDSSASRLRFLSSCLSCFVPDFIVRQKVGGTHLTYGYFNQIPLLRPSSFTHRETHLDRSLLPVHWLTGRILEMVYTAWDLEPFARDCGYDGPPFRWDDERRFQIRCELDAAFFHLYLPTNLDGSWKPARVAEGAVHDESPEQLDELQRHFPAPRDAVDYIMDTFPIVKRKDEQAHGRYRTKDTILEIYDAMQEAMRTGVPYRTRLDPPPGPPADADGNFIPFEQWRDNIPQHIHQPI